MKRIGIATSSAPAPIGPYSQGIVANGFIFVSGQIALDPATNKLADGIEAQTHQVMKNIQSVLVAADSDLSRLVKATLFLKSMSDFTTANAIYAKYLGDPLPARSTVEIAALPRNALIEIEVIASI